MELKFFIFLFVVLPFINCGKKEPTNFKNEVKDINKYVGKKIADDKLFLDGFLADGGTGFVYAGKFIDKDLSEVPVAIKFYPIDRSRTVKKVIKIFKKLGAIEKPQIEGKGFPNVYYHGESKFKCENGEWESYYLIAMTKLDRSLEDILKKETIRPLDMLILFKQFVILSEQMHTSGVTHGDVNSGNIMIRANQCFLIDFDVGEEMGKMREKEKYELTHKDWKEFIYMITKHYDGNCYLKDLVAYQNAIKNLKLDEGLKNVMEEFAKEAFSTVSSKILPDYDHLKNVIDNVIKKEHPNSGSNPTFSWPLN